MAEEQNQHLNGSEETEVKDRGFLGFGSKKEGGDTEAIKRPQDQEEVASELEKVEVYEEPTYQKEEEPEEKKHTLGDELHRSQSNKSISSSSDEEEVGEDGEKKKKKKGLKEKLFGDKKEAELQDTSIPTEKIEAEPAAEEHKGFVEKIKEKLPGGEKKAEGETLDLSTPPPPAYQVPTPPVVEEEKEKKGLLDKIKEKLPGHHKTGEEKEKDIVTPHAGQY